MKRSSRLLFVSALLMGLLIPAQAPASALDGTLDVTAETADRATGTVHVLTATLTAVMGAPASVEGETIAFEIEGGPQDPDVGAPFVAANPADKTCTTNASGTCSVTHQATGETMTPQEITAWHEEDPVALPDDADTTETVATADADDTDAVDVEWFDAVLNLEPEVNTTTVTQPQQLTITVLEKEPATPPAKALLANVDVEITAGPNTNLNANAATSDLECDTAQATGQCVLSYTGSATPGEDAIRGHIDNNDNGIQAPAMGAAGDEQPPASGEADTTEGANETTAQGGTAEPDRTDVILITRTVLAPPAPTPPTPPFPTPPPPPDCKKLVGKKGDDKLIGSRGCDILKGRGGDDLLLGKGGDDRLVGGGGDDIAKGGPGKDKCTAEKEKGC